MEKGELFRTEVKILSEIDPFKHSPFEIHEFVFNYNRNNNNCSNSNGQPQGLSVLWCV